MGVSRYVKTTIIGWALIIALLGFYVSLFVLRQRFVSPIRLLGVFCVLPYVIIYFHRYWRYGIAALGLISFGLGFYAGWDIYLVLGFAAALLGLYQASHTIHEDVHNKIKVSDHDVFTGEYVSKFVNYMTIVYVFTFVSFHDTFTLTCDQLFQYSNKIVSVILLRDNPEKARTIEDGIIQFFETKVDGAIQESLHRNSTSGAIVSDGNTTSKQIPSVNQKPDPADKYRVPEEKPISSTISPSVLDAITAHNTIQTGVMQTGSIQTAAWVGAFINSLKSFVTQTVDNADSLEHGTCEMIIQQVSEKYTNPDFKISVIVLMYLMMRPALELIVHVISYINRGLFRIMFKLGWFKKYEDWEVSENLE